MTAFLGHMDFSSSHHASFYSQFSNILSPFKSFVYFPNLLISLPSPPSLLSSSPFPRLENNTEPGNYTIQIVLHDRSRSRLTISPSTTVFAIYQHVMAISNITTSFQLIAGFPPVPLTNPSATAEQAKLKNASITQKL